MASPVRRRRLAASTGDGDGKETRPLWEAGRHLLLARRGRRALCEAVCEARTPDAKVWWYWGPRRRSLREAMWEPHA